MHGVLRLIVTLDGEAHISGKCPTFECGLNYSVPSRYFRYWVSYTLYMPTAIDMVSPQNDTSFG